MGVDKVERGERQVRREAEIAAPPLLLLYMCPHKPPFRLYRGANTDLLRLIKALLRLNQGSIKALLKLY